MQYKRNWPEYNNKLVARGEINLDPRVLQNWDCELRRMNRHKEGHRFEFPDSFIHFVGILKTEFGFSYRKIIGLIRFLSKLCPMLRKIPHYATLFRRMNQLKLDISKTIPRSNLPLFISIDASGLKTDHGGSWFEKRFGRKKRGYVKIHFAIDVKTKRIIDLAVTTDRVHDNRRFRGLVRRAAKRHRIDKVTADPAYDDYKNYELLHKKKIRAAIKPKMNSNPETWTLTRNERKFHRFRHILLFQKYRFKTWKKKTGYNYRTLNESCFSAFKAGYGDGIRSKRMDYARQEVLWKACAYNLSR
jgi:hypothetical protein